MLILYIVLSSYKKYNFKCIYFAVIDQCAIPLLTISQYTKFKILIYFEADHFTTIEQN